MNAYPQAAGYKERETSKDAAEAIERTGKAQRLRNATYAAILASGGRGLTGKEIADVLRVDITSIRPRITELKAAEMIAKSGRRKDKQHLWVA